MANSIQDILSAIQNGVTGINNVAVKLGNIFPQTTATSTSTPTAGGITFSSSQASLFMIVTTSSGGSYRLALYSS